MQDQTANFSPLALRGMRQAQQLSLKAFWGAIGYSTPCGSAYETGRTKLPEQARRLVYLEYVAGIPTDIDSERFHQFETALKSNNPASITQARKMLEIGIDTMQSTLTRLSHE